MPVRKADETAWEFAARASYRPNQLKRSGYVQCSRCSERFTEVDGDHLIRRMLNAGWVIRVTDKEVLNLCPRHGTS